MNTYTLNHKGLLFEDIPLDSLTSQLQSQGLIVLLPHELKNNFKPLEQIETLIDCLYEYGRYFFKRVKSGIDEDFPGNSDLECVHDFIEEMKEQPFIKATAANPLHDVVEVKSAQTVLDDVMKKYPYEATKGYKYLSDWIIEAMEEYDSQLHSAPIENNVLKKAVDLIKQWHNMQSYIARRPEKEINEMWEIYYNNAPEIKTIRESINQPSAPISSNKRTNVDNGDLANWGPEPTTLNT
jgi:hypothetical protein